MDELVIMALVAVGLHVVIDIVLMCVYARRNRKNKEGKHHDDGRSQRDDTVGKVD